MRPTFSFPNVSRLLVSDNFLGNDVTESEGFVLTFGIVAEFL